MRIHRPRHTQGWLCGGTPWDVELDDRRKGVSGCGNPFHLTASFELMLPRWMMILAIQRDKIYGQDRSSVSRRKTKTTVEFAASNSSPIINLMGSDSPNAPGHWPISADDRQPEPHCRATMISKSSRNLTESFYAPRSKVAGPLTALIPPSESAPIDDSINDTRQLVNGIEEIQMNIGYLFLQ